MAVRKSNQPAKAQTRLAGNEGERRQTSREFEDAAGLQRLLHSELAREAPATAPTETPPVEKTGPQVELHPAADRRSQSNNRRKVPAKSYSKLIKTIIGVVVVAVVGWMPVQRLFETSSVQAVINATLVNVRSPISGVVGGAIGELTVGKSVNLGNPLATIENSRIDANDVGHASEMLASQNADLNGVQERIAGLETIRDNMAARVAAYSQDRARRLEARIAGANARIDRVRAERDLLAIELGRLPNTSGKTAKAKSQQAEMNLRIVAADATIAEAEASRQVYVAEKAALEAGRFLGDDYNDNPRSAQRIDDINEMLVQLRADERRMLQQLSDSRDNLTQKAEYLNPQRYAALDAPVGGRIWEILTAPGEQVGADQPLLSLIDCSKLIVTAAVSESVYNFLSLGRSVKFLMDGSKVELPGTIVQLSGVAAAGSNFAINPSALTKEAYRVSISIDSKALGESCPVGRSGRVVFKQN